MFPIKPILKFLVIFFVVFVILILPWPGLRGGYAAVYRWIGNTCWSSFSSVAAMRFEPLEPGEIDDAEGRDTKLTFRHRTVQAPPFTMAVNTRFQGYTPTAFVIALILASPVPWKRRLLALLIGIVLVSAFVAFRQYVFIANVIYQPEGVMGKVREFAYWVFVESFAGVFVIPLVIWLVATFRRRDLEAMVRGKAAAPADESGHKSRKKEG